MSPKGNETRIVTRCWVSFSRTGRAADLRKRNRPRYDMEFAASEPQGWTAGQFELQFSSSVASRGEYSHGIADRAS